jgi:beta-phosphoglucomutase
MASSGVIFDLDGVLIDSYDAHFASWRALYGELGIEYSEEAFAADFGRTSRDILRRTLGNELSDERIAELDTHKESLFRAALCENFPAMEGAVELLDVLSDAGFLLAVGSSGPPENIELVLDKLGRAQKFAAVVTGAEVTRGKPDPQVFKLAAERLALPPQRCAVVEDAVHGVEAARRAGMAVIALIGTATREELRHADMVVGNLRELTPEIIRLLIDRGA